MTRPFPDYAILAQPNIPKPLHGLNPRTLLWDNWWDIQRHTAYAEHKHRCWACGIDEYSAKYKQQLDAHECYIYDYKKGEAKLDYIAALCYSCHNFIHSGRLWSLYRRGNIKKYIIKDILDSRLAILQEHHLQPFWGTVLTRKLLDGTSMPKALKELKREGYDIEAYGMATWEKWHLVIDGKKYYSKFKDYGEWEDFYKHYDE